jgi:hypothetical protein
MARLITINSLPVSELTLKQLRMAVRPYSIIQDRAKLLSAIEVVKGEEDDLAEPANSVIEAKDRDVVKLTREARPCLSGLAKETFVSDKDNKSEIKFV